MRKSFLKDHQELEIIYAESFHHDFYVELSSYFQKAPCIFFVSSLTFYETYYEKMVKSLKKGQSFQWYICHGNQRIETIKTYQKVVDFIDETNMPTHTILVGAGNQSIYQLCAFLKETSPYIDTLIYFATTIKGFSEALSGQAYLCGETPNFPVVKECVMPNYLIYSQPLNRLESKMSWHEDFHTLMTLGLSTDEELYQLLREMQPIQYGASLVPYLEKVIETQKTNKLDSGFPIAAFLKGFYQLVESHYLTKYQKELMAFLLYFLWCIKKNSINFDFKSFVLWYEKMLKIELTFPRQMNIYDLAESIIIGINRFESIVGIQSIGKLATMEKPSLDELFQVITTYRKIKEE